MTPGLDIALAIFNDSTPGSRYTEHERLLARTVFSLKVRLDAAEKERDELRVDYESSLNASARLMKERDEARRQRDGEGPVPTDAGGPGKEEAYWLRCKLNASIRHLRDVARVAALEKALTRAAFVARNLHAMIDRDAWRDSGGDDGQGNYEGDYHAAQVVAEIGEWEVLAGSLPLAPRVRRHVYVFEKERRDEDDGAWAVKDEPGVVPSVQVQHECQRCGSDEWTDVDYSGCSECREPVERQLPARLRQHEDDGA